MFIFGLHSTSDDWPSNLSKKCWPKCIKSEKGPLSHQKIKCSFLDYIQLLMQSEQKTWPHQKIKCSFIFGLCSTSDDWPSNPSKNIAIWPPKSLKNVVHQNAKKWKRPPKSSKNQMFIFGLCSTSDDWPSNLSKKCWPKCKKMKEAP